MKKIIPIALIVVFALIFCFDRTSKPFEEIEVSDEDFLLNHKGKVKIKEAKRTLLQGKSFKITQMGNYEVGKDISKGTYTVTLSSVPEKENSIGMFLWNENLDQCLEQYDFQKRNDIVSLTLKEGQILQVY